VHFVVGALLVVIAAVACLGLVSGVTRVRGGVHDRVVLLVSLRTTEEAIAAAVDADGTAGALDEAVERLGDLEPQILSLGSAPIRDAYRAIQTSVSALPGAAAPARDDAWSAVRHDFDSLVRTIRRENGALSGQLGRWWGWLGTLLAVALGLAVALLVLMLFEDRARLRAEALSAEVDQARARAEEANAAKSRFLATISHELRTPLDGVVGMADLLGATPLNEEQAEYVDVVRSSGDALVSLIEQLLNYARLEAEPVELRPELLDLPELVEECVLLVAPRPSAAGVGLSVRFDPGVPRRLRGDPVRLRQVLLNLLANAVKFTSEGAIAVRAALLEDSLDDALIRIEVEDSGPGVDPSLRGRLFEAFTSTDGPDDRGGVGLGLAIVRRLAARMGGEAGFDEGEGGSTFWFTAHLDKVDGGTWHRPERARLAGRRVLILDPDAGNRAVLEAELSAAGALPTAIGSWRQAPPEPPDLLLMAWQPGQPLKLPDDLYRRWAHVTRIATVPLGTVPTDLPREGAVSGTIQCPLRPTRLLDRIEHILGDAPAIDQTMDAPPPTALDVLVVDDNDINRRLTAVLLRRAGFRVGVAANGAEAVDMAATRRFALILMDCQMPVMDGFEATRLIRAAEVDYRAPILAVTGDAFPGERNRFEACGMDDVLAKPVSPERLREAVAAWAVDEEA